MIALVAIAALAAGLYVGWTIRRFVSELNRYLEALDEEAQ